MGSRRTASRPLLTAELLAIGSELTVGDTRDTNGGELARWLTGAGVAVARITALPDRLDVVTEAYADALGRADLVVSTGGLGPTPDDLTREAIAAVCDEIPTVDADLERWLREMWARRGMPFPAVNLKQAWRIPSAEPLPNANGTAPGWYVTRPDGRVVVALPGPPREMRPIWHEQAVPRLRARPGGLGAPFAVRTYRLTGIGESQVAEILGDDLLRRPNPEVATYARVEAVDVRISAVDEADRSADALLADAAATVEARLGDHIWATGETTWAEAIGERLAASGQELAVVEIGTGGQLATLLGDVPWLRAVDVRRDDHLGDDPAVREAALLALARASRDGSAGGVGLAVVARDRGADVEAVIAVATPTQERIQRRVAFLGGRHGRSRAALAAAAVLYEAVRGDTSP